MRMNDLQSGNTRLVYVSIGCGSSSQQQTIADGPLLKALTTLFRAFDKVADQTGLVNSDTYFVFNVIKQIVDCGKDTAKPILATLSNTLVCYSKASGFCNKMSKELGLICTIFFTDSQLDALSTGSIYNGIDLAVV